MGKLGRFVGEQNLRAWKLRHYSQSLKTFETNGFNAVVHLGAEGHAVDPVNFRPTTLPIGWAGKEKVYPTGDVADPQAATGLPTTIPTNTSTTGYMHWQAYADTMMFSNFYYDGANTRTDWYGLDATDFHFAPFHLPDTATKLTRQFALKDDTTANMLAMEQQGQKTLTMSEKFHTGHVEESQYRKSRHIYLVATKMFITFRKRNTSTMEENDQQGDLNECFSGDFIIGYQNGFNFDQMIKAASKDGQDIRATTEIADIFIRKYVPVATATAPHCLGCEWPIPIVDATQTGHNGGVGTATLDQGYSYSSPLKAKRWARDADHCIGNLKPYYLDKKLFTPIHEFVWKIEKGKVSTDYSVDVVWNGQQGIKMSYYNAGDSTSYQNNLLNCCLDMNEKTLPFQHAPQWICTVWGDSTTWSGTDYVGPAGNGENMEHRVVDLSIRQIHYWRDCEE